MATALCLAVVLPLLGVAGGLGYLAWQRQQRSVRELSQQVSTQLSDRVGEVLEATLALPPLVTQWLVQDLEAGTIDVRGEKLQALDRYFLQRSQMLQDQIRFIYVGTEQGQLIGIEPLQSSKTPSALVTIVDATTQGSTVSYTLNANGQRVRTTEVVSKYDPRDRPWYRTGMSRKTLGWGEPYALVRSGQADLSVATIQPFSSAGKLQGVVAVGLSLSELSHTLQRAFGDVEHVFILDPQGFLVASSTPQPLAYQTQTQVQRILATDSKETLLRETSQAVQQQLGELVRPHPYAFRAEIAGQAQWVQVSPWRDRQGLDWRIVTVVPETQLTRSLPGLPWGQMLGVGGIILLGGVGLAGLLARWIAAQTQPLNQSIQSLLQGQLQPTEIDRRSDDFGQLARSLTQLAERWQTSLKQVQTLNTALSNHQQLSHLLDTLPVGVMMVNHEGYCVYLNTTGRILLGIKKVPPIPLERMTVAYQIYRAGTSDLYPTDDLPVVQALQGKSVYRDDLEVRRRQMRIPLEVRATPVLDRQGHVIYSLQTLQNVSARKQAEAALRQSEARLRRLTDNVPGVIYRYALYPDGSGLFLYISPQVQALYELAPQVVLQDAQQLWSLLSPQDLDTLQQQAVTAETTQQSWSLEYAIRTASGQTKWIQTYAAPDPAPPDAPSPDQPVLIWDGVFLDITERKQAEAILADYRQTLEQEVQQRTSALQQAQRELERLATLDGLTQVANRRRFETGLKREWQRLSREQQPLSLILCDMDYFRRYNELHGSSSGNSCLHLLAQTLADQVQRPADLVARYGGATFAILLPNTNRRGAREVAQKLRSAVHQVNLPHGASPIGANVTLSFGVATVIPLQQTSVQVLLEQAEAALTTAKQEGRDRIIYSQLASS
jgi:diguanylate cyclase (GGDEF)-like protein